MQEEKILGTMMPVGGGDPIPLKKKEVIIGRRPSSDVRLDFENVSGRHCVLSFINGTWHIRDLASTNGTKVNGQKLNRVQAIMPDDELAIASHLFHIDYEPAAPLLDSQHLLEEEEAIQSGESRKPTSLMELAGFSDESRSRPRPRPRPEDQPQAFSEPQAQPQPEPTEPPAPEPPGDDPSDDDLPPESPPNPIQDDDFFKLIEDEVRHNRG